jgi:magnesium chelatase family protein
VRQNERQGKANARLDNREVASHTHADGHALAILARAMKQLALSARAYHRVLRVARTIADLAGSVEVRTGHIAEAVTLRSLDRRSADAASTAVSG